MIPVLFLLTCIIFGVQSNPFGSFTECPSGTNDCVINAARKMYALILEPNEKIGAEDMDPMYQKLIVGELENISYELTNSTIKGFKTCEVQKASFDLSTQIIEMGCLCMNFELQGHYHLKGRILSKGLEGNGNYKIITGKYSLNFNLHLDGTKYKTIKSFTFKATPLESPHYQFTNLHGSNNESGEEITDYINRNSKAVTIIWQGPPFKANLQKIVNNANKYLMN